MKICVKILLLLLLPCCSFALGLNSYFQQGFKVSNFANQIITVSDTNPATPDYQNVAISPEYYDQIKYASDQFTNSAGQTFTRTVNIYSKSDNKLICTVTGNLVLGGNDSMDLHADSSDKSKCSSRVEYITSHVNGLLDIYMGYEVNVTSV